MIKNKLTRSKLSNYQKIIKKHIENKIIYELVLFFI